jgi:hypothetical protein
MIFETTRGLSGWYLSRSGLGYAAGHQVAVTDQAMTELLVRFLDGTEETRFVPGLVGDCVKLIISWRAEPVTFERDRDGIYVEQVDGKCDDEAPRQSTNDRRARRRTVNDRMMGS